MAQDQPDYDPTKNDQDAPTNTQKQDLSFLRSDLDGLLAERCYEVGLTVPGDEGFVIPIETHAGNKFTVAVTRQ